MASKKAEETGNLLAELEEAEETEGMEYATNIQKQVAYREVDIASIIIDPDRARTDLGDLSGLTDSIKRIGLIQDIVVDQNTHLISGERRLTALKLAGVKKVTVKIFSELEDLDRLLIEATENIQRQNFTWYEECAVRAKVHEMLVNKFGDKAKHRNTGWGLSDTGRLLGCSRTTIALDLMLSVTVKAMPELRMLSRRTALERLYDMRLKAILKELAKRGAHSVSAEEVEEFHAEDYDEDGTIQELDKLIIQEDFKPSLLSKVDPWNQPNIEKPFNFFKGDCRDFLTTIKSGSVHLIITDPPWGVDIFKTSSIKATVEYKDDKYTVRQMMIAVMPELARVLSEDGYIVMFLHAQEYHFITGLFEDCGIFWRPAPIIWDKCAPGSADANSQVAPSYEMLLLGFKASPRPLNFPMRDVLEYFRVPGTHKVHPNEKPVLLIQELISQFSYREEIILDPFLGSFATAIAAIHMRRKIIGSELEEYYYNEGVKSVAFQFARDIKETIVGTDYGSEAWKTVGFKIESSKKKEDVDG